MDILKDIQLLNTGTKELRKFGLTVGAVFLGLGVWCAYRQKPYSFYLLVIGAALVLAALIIPSFLKYVYIAWMTLAFFLGTIVSTIILSLFFVFVITPIGWVAKIARKDFLSLKLEPSKSTYWIDRDPVRLEREEYEKQG